MVTPPDPGHPPDRSLSGQLRLRHRLQDHPPRTRTVLRGTYRLIELTILGALPAAVFGLLDMLGDSARHKAFNTAITLPSPVLRASQYSPPERTHAGGSSPAKNTRCTTCDRCPNLPHGARDCRRPRRSRLCAASNWADVTHRGVSRSSGSDAGPSGEGCSVTVRVASASRGLTGGHRGRCSYPAAVSGPGVGSAWRPRGFDCYSTVTGKPAAAHSGKPSSSRAAVTPSLLSIRAAWSA
jgi:hypothetical protein